ncbi:MAG TPA: iron-containing alcohol dehydrogenase [Pirellulaceae bacterium]|nr:iron-containing alcohol dehydrogenase [Pirellulaceae bacterium]
MTPFEFETRTRLIFGPGSSARLGELATELGAKRALLVSDPGIVKVGHADQGMESLEAAGLEVGLFADIEENPTTAHVEGGVAFAKTFKPDLIVGLGGGSSIDCAKGINFVLTNGGRMQDYWGVGKATLPMLPMIAVPTTAGTGSETQSFALISDAETHAKMACGDKKAACRIAVLDPELTVTQPPAVTALTGIDAIAHSIETFVTRKRNVVSLEFSRRAWSLLSESFLSVLERPDDLEARGSMQLGAALAGLAIENSMLGAAHSLANPLTAKYGIVHGQAVGAMLPHVIRFNGEKFGDRYDLLLFGTSNGKHTAGEALAVRVEEFLAASGLKSRLSELGVVPSDFEALAEDAAKQWTASFNPREIGPADCQAIYQRAL